MSRPEQMENEQFRAASAKTIVLAFAAFAAAFVVTAAASTPLSATGVWTLSFVFGLMAALMVFAYNRRLGEP